MLFRSLLSQRTSLYSKKSGLLCLKDKASEPMDEAFCCKDEASEKMDGAFCQKDEASGQMDETSSGKVKAFGEMEGQSSEKVSAFVQIDEALNCKDEAFVCFPSSIEQTGSSLTEFLQDHFQFSFRMKRLPMIEEHLVSGEGQTVKPIAGQFCACEAISNHA